ncbi:unnamed protein product [Symbiodinium natans]|uniref:Uncharacterized protein n=1 Tax=Symbiodinium natans TaxID=878477 RepID=A0A812K7G0_9DINO|nr:unnamed protein product [Symbiodinium natans]
MAPPFAVQSLNGLIGLFLSGGPGWPRPRKLSNFSSKLQPEVEIVENTPSNLRRVEIREQHQGRGTGLAHLAQECSRASEIQLAWKLVDVLSGNPTVVTDQRGIPVTLQGKGLPEVLPIPTNLSDHEASAGRRQWPASFIEVSHYTVENWLQGWPAQVVGHMQDSQDETAIPSRFRSPERALIESGIVPEEFKGDGPPTRLLAVVLRPGNPCLYGVSPVSLHSLVRNHNTNIVKKKLQELSSIVERYRPCTVFEVSQLDRHLNHLHILRCCILTVALGRQEEAICGSKQVLQDGLLCLGIGQQGLLLWIRFRLTSREIQSSLHSSSMSSGLSRTSSGWLASLYSLIAVAVASPNFWVSSAMVSHRFTPRLVRLSLLATLIKTLLFLQFSSLALFSADLALLPIEQISDGELGPLVGLPFLLLLLFLCFFLILLLLVGTVPCPIAALVPATPAMPGILVVPLAVLAIPIAPSSTHVVASLGQMVGSFFGAACNWFSSWFSQLRGGDLGAFFVGGSSLSGAACDSAASSGSGFVSWFLLFRDSLRLGSILRQFLLFRDSLRLGSILRPFLLFRDSFRLGSILRQWLRLLAGEAASSCCLAAFFFVASWLHRLQVKLQVPHDCFERPGASGLLRDQVRHGCFEPRHGQLLSCGSEAGARLRRRHSLGGFWDAGLHSCCCGILPKKLLSRATTAALWASSTWAEG